MFKEALLIVVLIGGDYKAASMDTIQLHVSNTAACHVLGKQIVVNHQNEMLKHEHNRRANQSYYDCYDAENIVR